MLIAKALLTITMYTYNGNATVGSESAILTESVTECRSAMSAFMQSKGQVKGVSRSENSLAFTAISDSMFKPSTDFKVSCTELKD